MGARSEMSRPRRLPEFGLLAGCQIPDQELVHPRVGSPWRPRGNEMIFRELPVIKINTGVSWSYPWSYRELEPALPGRRFRVEDLAADPQDMPLLRVECIIG